MAIKATKCLRPIQSGNGFLDSEQPSNDYHSITHTHTHPQWKL